jgi:sterol desaturase/sphingolipid hydroxylase (fatty acid hydroxylase superfamily)
MIILQFIVILFIVAVPGYFIPAGQYYWRYYRPPKAADEPRRVQKTRRPLRDQIRREIRLSLVTCVIFAAMGTILWNMYLADQTSIYLRFRDYPLWYLPVSFALCLILHDTYFYWTHRLMHTRLLFKYTHAGHHQSITPTPWAIYAFQPGEAIIQFLGIMALVIFVPLHPVILFGFLAYDTQINTAGHCGFEIAPRWFAQSRWFRGFSTVTHHDAHHTNYRKNFGSFFNIWDRLMGTFLDAQTIPEEQKQPTPKHTAERPLKPRVQQMPAPSGAELQA